MGGIPRDPKLIEDWIRGKTKLIEDEAEMRTMVLRTMFELGYEVSPEMTWEEINEATSKLAGVKETTGFKRDDQGLYVESRQLKAMLKENTNILFAGDKAFATHPNNPTRKGARSFLAERVFVSPDHVALGCSEPSGVEMIVGHVTGPKGPRSTLGYHEYVLRPELTFDVLVTRDAIPEEWWPVLWTQAEENGFGALRSQGYGRFDILAWDKVPFTENSPIPAAFAAALA